MVSPLRPGSNVGLTCSLLWFSQMCVQGQANRMDDRAKLETPVLVVGDSEGDGPILRLIPPPFKGIIRGTQNRMAAQRINRLLRVAGEFYPLLQRMEDKALAEEEKRLAGVPFAKALLSDESIERGLRLFVSAWKSNVFRLLDEQGKAIPPEKVKTAMGACGLTVEQGMSYFINLALAQIFKKNVKVQRRLVGAVTDPQLLPKVRLLSHFDALALTELTMGFGHTIGPVLVTIQNEQLYALASLKAYHLRALRQVFRAGFKNIAKWDPEVIRAISHSFTCVEQMLDLGEALGVISSAEGMAAVGAWEIRDITDRINEERASRGEPKIAGNRFETDIAAADKIFGSYFTSIMSEPPDIIEGMGKVVADIRRTDKVDRKDRIEEVRLFLDRYLEFMTADVFRALGLAGPRPGSFGQALFICEGLFSKPGVGRKFFEEALKTPEGIKALTNLRKDVEDMRRGGQLKAEPEIRTLVQNSDMLDKHILQYIKFR